MNHTADQVRSLASIAAAQGQPVTAEMLNAYADLLAQREAAPVGVPALDVGEIEECLNSCFISYHDSNGIPADPGYLATLANYGAIDIADMLDAAPAAPAQPQAGYWSDAKTFECDPPHQAAWLTATQRHVIDCCDSWCKVEQLPTYSEISAALAQSAGQSDDKRDAFDLLVADAKAEAGKAMIRFPQPNYVITKVAEEAGEVVKAAVHFAEGRETASNVRGEMKQAIAMLYRLWVEGDQVHGCPAIDAAVQAEGGTQ